MASFEPLTSPLACRILVLDAGGAGNARLVRRALCSVVESVEVASSLADIHGSDWDMLVVNYDSFASEWEQVLERFGTAHRQGRVLVYVANPTRELCARLIKGFDLTHLLGDLGSHGTEELLVTVPTLLRRDIFGIGKYLPWASTENQVRVRASDQRPIWLRTVSEFVVNIPIHSRLAEQFTTCVDELVSNALFNAPIDANGPSKRIAEHKAAERFLVREGVWEDIV